MAVMLVCFYLPMHACICISTHTYLICRIMTKTKSCLCRRSSDLPCHPPHSRSSHPHILRIPTLSQDSAPTSPALTTIAVTVLLVMTTRKATSEPTAKMKLRRSKTEKKIPFSSPLFLPSQLSLNTLSKTLNK